MILQRNLHISDEKGEDPVLDSWYQDMGGSGSDINTMNRSIDCFAS